MVCRIILGDQYKSYTEALATLELCSLVGRREQLLRGFGEKLHISECHMHQCFRNQKRSDMEETSGVLIS